MPSARRLPPLNAIRAFESAARQESFVAAADELHVTASAISQQVKSLEEWLGLELFIRQPRGLMLTDAGRRYLPSLTEMLDRLSDETRRLLDTRQDQSLTVTAMPSLAALWLVPRLHRFTDKHPDICVRIATSSRLMDYTREGIDVGIRYGLGNYAALHTEHLMDEDITPVCSPLLLQKGPPINSVEDLLQHRLLVDGGSPLPNTRICWEQWLKAFGLEDVDFSSSLAFDDTHLTTMAATAGRGIMLGRSVLIADAVASGALVRPLDIALPAGASYHFACPEDYLDLPKIQAFRAWLHEEAQRPTSDDN